MARTRATGGSALIPPPSMDVAFLPDGLLGNESEVDSAKPLGVREFTVDNVLDRIGGAGAAEDVPGSTLRFLWSLLVRERRSDFSTRAAAERAAEFDPTAWFWCRPGEGGGAGTEPDRQRRRRHLAETPLPARDGTWRPAEELAFGPEWADWLETGACGESSGAIRARISAYRALGQVAPGDDVLLAPPDLVLGYLSDAAFGSHDATVEERNSERLGFLLTLGVWEVVPVEAYENRETRNREAFPWGGDPLSELRMDTIQHAGGWRFASFRWSGGEHQRVYVAEDYRFRWSLTAAAARDVESTVALLSAGSPFYRRLASLAVFCPGCSSRGGRHSVWYHSAAEDQYPSLLGLQLQTEAWVPAIADGKPLDAPQIAPTVWWTEKPPAGAGLRQSPLRYLRLCDPRVEIAADLRALARIGRLESADAGQVENLLKDLREGFDTDGLVISPESSSSARQAFVGLHRVAYDRLYELTGDDPALAVAMVERVGLLCDIGDRLDYVSPPSDARHDDGRFASYRRYFAGRVPFAALARERAQTAGRLGIPSFDVSLSRRATGTPRDVTDDVAEMLAERVPELLAIVVHYSLGTQTLEPASPAFEERSKRLQRVRVHQVDELVIDATVHGTTERATIGAGVGEHVFLEAGTSVEPVIYHDLNDEDWKDGLRKRLAQPLAVILENAAYASTFKILLLADSDDEREEVLHELGISGEDVDAIRSAIGAVSDEERARQQRWYAAIAAAAGSAPVAPATSLDEVEAMLIAAGLTVDVARRLIEIGGGQEVRADVSPEGALALLVAHGIGLEDLDTALRSADSFDRLAVDVAQRRLSRWIRANRQRAAAVLAQSRPPAEAKAEPDLWKVDPGLRFELDPLPAEWLAPVVASFRAAGFEPAADQLALAPVTELVRLGGLRASGELEALAKHLYNETEQKQILRAAAAAWRHELLLLGILVRTGVAESRAVIRAQAQAVGELLPVGPETPAALDATVDDLFSSHPSFAETVAGLLMDAVSGNPDRSALKKLAEQHGISTEHYDAIEFALRAPRRELAQKLQAHMTELEAEALRPELPKGLKPAKRNAKSPEQRTKVPALKVKPSTDARKRRLGDEGERWALAAVLAEFVALEASERRSAVGEIVTLLQLFSGSPVDEALAHAEPACEPELDDEELIDELTELLHVSRRSDWFGFDLVGWLSPIPGAEPEAVCLEVKSTRDGTFHLSRNEWDRARWFHERGEGTRYAVLVVHRSRGGGPPKRLDLLADPVELVETGQLAKSDDGYELAYRAA